MDGSWFVRLGWLPFTQIDPEGNALRVGRESLVLTAAALAQKHNRHGGAFLDLLMVRFGTTVRSALSPTWRVEGLPEPHS